MIELKSSETLIRVLLIEDDPIATRLLAADFGAHGRDFEFMTVSRLSEALPVLQKTRIDVILLDLCLEDSSGLDALFAMRGVGFDIPVVILTGIDDEAQALEALKNGAQDYIIKGNVDRHTLFRAIRYAIERKHAETRRILLELRLLEAQKLEAVGTLAGGVAHNFNNSLTVILGNSHLMLEEFAAGDSNRKYVESIKKAADRAALLVRRLLTFGQRQRPDDPLPISLSKIVSDMQVLLDSILGSEIQLQVKVAPGTGLIRADPGQIQQTILNLVLNARDAMPEGGAILIETRKTAEQVHLIISDTGEGMSPETCAHIFEPFFTTKGLASASGLGLSTVYGIVKHHGGSIEVTSAPGAGTSFAIAFPVFDATGDASDLVSLAGKPQAATT